MEFNDNISIIADIYSANKAVLVEPPYRQYKYIPVGLAKIGAIIPNCVFTKEYQPIDEDLVCVTSVFTYDADRVHAALNDIYKKNENANVVIGGIYATLCPNRIKEAFPKARVYIGYSKALDIVPPNYDLNFNVDGFWGEQCSYVFTTRGCPNKCAYCFVKRIEPDPWINPNWLGAINQSRPIVICGDNNLTAWDRGHVQEVFEFFHSSGKKAIFNNGFDLKCVDKEIAKWMAKVHWMPGGLRISFDRIEEDGLFQEKVSMLLKYGIPKSAFMVFTLFNFNDTPKDAVYRMTESIKLGIRPYPCTYTPLVFNRKDRANFVGKHWTKELKMKFHRFYNLAGYYRKYDFWEWMKK